MTDLYINLQSQLKYLISSERTHNDSFSCVGGICYIRESFLWPGC